MESAQLAFTDARGGMNSSDPPHKIATNQLARMTNCALVNQLPSTRKGVRVISLAGDGVGAVSDGNIQGSIFFNPAKGQGGIILGQNNSMIAVASAGRKFVTRIEGRRARTVGTVTEITSNFFANPQFHLVWMGAWEDLLVMQDGQAPAMIWDGNVTVESRGYSTLDKPRSEIPNGGTVLAFAHGRGVCIVNSRFVLVGDSLHKISLTTSADLKKFTEQTYWATGQYFLPPSKMGNIMAADILPLRNTQHGHGDLIVHCEDGIFSIDLNIFPRSSWSQTPMVRHALLDCGAVGPYALAIHDGDQVFRTHKGIQTLRSAAAESPLEGNPNQPISHEVDTWLKSDYPRWLRFASLALWDTARKFLCTTSPIVQGRHRWHRGAVVREVDPKLTEKGTPPSWAGLLTLPPEIGGIVQFVSGIFAGEERFFAWCRGVDGKNRLVEFTDYLEQDELEGGVRRDIRCQAITRVVDLGEWWKKREFRFVTLFLAGIIGKVTWGVWVRTAERTDWVPMQTGTVNVPRINGADLAQGIPRSLPIQLGNIPESCVPDAGKLNETRGVQFLVRWEGVCQLEGVKVFHSDKDLTEQNVDKAKFDFTFGPAPATTYNDFEYFEFRSNPWITK